MYIVKWLLVFLFGIPALGQSGYLSSNNSVAFPKTKHPFIVIAHRGNHTNAPENSLESLKNAIRAEVDFVETDIRTTHDGHLVIMHDATVERTTNGTGKVSEMTLTEFKVLRLKGSMLTAPPTFEELLQNAQGKINLYLDVKEADPEQLGGLLKKYNMQHSVVIYTEIATLKTWKKLYPSIPVMVSAPDHIKTVKELTVWLSENPVDILDGSVLFYTREKVDFLTQKGIQVWPDIQNPNESPAQWQNAIDLGIHGLQTDHPEGLIPYLQTINRH